MASSPKLLCLPRLQLLALVLVLGVGLLPKNPMAQNQTAPKPNTGSAPVARTTLPSPDPVPNPNKSPIKCWKQDCEGFFDCLKTPAEPAATKIDCISGYCLQAIFKYKNQTSNLVIRRCADYPWEVDCLKKEPGNCFRLNLTGNIKIDYDDNYPDYFKCAYGAKPSDWNSTGTGETGSGPGTREECMCDKDLCNGGGTLAGPTGGIHLALMGALLVMVAFPFQTLFLVT